MPTLPALQILYRRDSDMMFGWNPTDGIKSYNIYSSASPTGPFVIAKSGIKNVADKSVYRGKVIAYVKDADVGIPPLVRYYFRLTMIDTSDVESNVNLSPTMTVYPKNVEWHFENEQEDKNNHNFAWVEENQRWEKVLLTQDGKLKVDATVDIDNITLGNVKVAARPDGTTLEYILVDDERKLVVRFDPDSISRIADYEEIIDVLRASETTIFTYTNSDPYFIEKIVCSGTGDAVFKLKIDGTTTRTIRNSWNDRNVTFDFSTIAKKISANSTITVTATHVEKTNQDFETSLEGFTFTI